MSSSTFWKKTNGKRTNSPSIFFNTESFVYYPAILTFALLLSRIFFFSETKIPIYAAGLWSRSTGKMVDSPPPAAGSHQPGYLLNVLDLARWAMPYSPLTDFFPPLPDHSPHPQDVGATHRHVDPIYPRSPPPSIKCPASMNGNGSCMAILPGVCESTPMNVCF